MVKLSFSPKKRGKKGEGRKVEFEHILVPKEFASELKLLKDIYSLMSADSFDEFNTPIRKRISWEQLFRHWIDFIQEKEPDVWNEYLSCLESQSQFPEPYPVDVLEGPIWEMKHIFYRDGDELDAVAENGSFYAIEDGIKKSVEELFSEDWVLMNEAGIEIPMNQIPALSQILESHFQSSSSINPN